MVWVRIDDQFFFKPRARQAGKDGRALFWAGLCYCAANLTDGVIVKPALPFVAAMAEVEPEIADLLVHTGLWLDHGDSYEVDDYLTYQQSREQVLAERIAAAERQRRSRAKSRRDSQAGNGVTSRAPVPSPDKELSRQSSSRNSRGTSPPVDNPGDDDVPAAVWEHYAQLKLVSELRRKPDSITNETSWKRTTSRNAKTEHGDTAARWWAEYDISPQRLAECLIDGKAPGSQYRRKEPS